MDDLMHLINGNHHLLTKPLRSSQRRQLKLLYNELAFITKTISNIHHPHDLQKLRNLKTRFKDVVEEAQDIIDLYLYDASQFPLDLEDVMRSIESIKVELGAMIIINMMMDSSPRINRRHKTQSAAAAVGSTSTTRNRLGKNKPFMEEIVVGLDRDAELIRDKLVGDQKKLDVVSIVGMGGLGKTTLATKVFNDRFIVYHFRVRAWATISQTYNKRDFLMQILTSIGVQQDLEKDDDSQLRGKLHKLLMGRRYLIVIDDIWSIDAWHNLKLFFPHENTGSRILLTSRLNAVALHANPHGLVHSLPYLTKEQSWELLQKKVFHGDECPKWLIKHGMQIAEKCQGLPLSVVVMAGVLAKEAISKDLWESIACSVGSCIVSDKKGCLKTLALSYHHLPPHLKQCFLYLGGFPEDSRITAEMLMRLWVAEGFTEQVRNQSVEDTAEAYLMDLVDRNLVIVAERKFNGDVKACQLHDLVRELCLQKAKEKRFFLKIDRSSCSRLPAVITPRKLITQYEPYKPYKQVRVFTDQDHINIVFLARTPTPTIRSVLCFHKNLCVIDHESKHQHSFALLRVLDLQMCKKGSFPQGMELLVHLRYLAIWCSCFLSFICNLRSLQTLIVKAEGLITLPSNISDLVNLRHLWSNRMFFLPSIEKPMNLQSISTVRLGGGVDNFGNCFPNIRKLGFTLVLGEERCFELLPYLEKLKIWLSVNQPMDCEDAQKFRQSLTRFPATLTKLTLVGWRLPWSDMSIIQSLLNLEVLKLKDNAFKGTRWNASEQQFRQLKFLRLEKLNIIQWEAFSTSFPCLKRLRVWSCIDLEEIPLEIGEIGTLELIETDNRSSSVVESVKRIQQEQHDAGNCELKITVNGMELSFCLSKHESSESE